MIASALRHRYLVGAGVALVAVAAIIAALVVVVTDDGATPAPEFTLNSTRHPIPDGALGNGGGSCTTITRSTSGEGVIVHLLSSCRTRVEIEASQLPTLPLHEASPQEQPARPQSMSPGSFRGLPAVVTQHLPDLTDPISLRETLERLPLSVRRHLQRPAFTIPTESVVLYFQ